MSNSPRVTLESEIRREPEAAAPALTSLHGDTDPASDSTACRSQVVRHDPVA